MQTNQTPKPNKNPYKAKQTNKIIGKNLRNLKIYIIKSNIKNKHS